MLPKLTPRGDGAHRRDQRAARRLSRDRSRRHARSGRLRVQRGELLRRADVLPAAALDLGADAPLAHAGVEQRRRAARACPARCRRTSRRAAARCWRRSSAGRRGRCRRPGRGRRRRGRSRRRGWKCGFGTSQSRAEPAARRRRRRAPAGVEAEVGRVDVGRDDPERVAEQRQRLGDAAGGLERAAVVAPFHRVARSARPKREPSPSAATICSSSQAVLTTTSRTPPAASASRCHSISGLPCTSSSGFGRGVGQRPHALAAAGGEDDRLHSPRRCAWRSIARRRERREQRRRISVSARAELSAPRLQT